MKVWLGVGAVAVVAGALVWQQPQVILAKGGISTPAPATGAHHAVTASQASVMPEALQKLDTYRGATMDGALRTDHKGQLVIDMQLRHWIDFHLSAQGELALADIILTMQEQMKALPEPGQSQALALLDSYLGYLAALANYDEEAARRLVSADMGDLAARFAWQQRLRREWLSPAVVDAFFAAEEKIDEYTLASHQLRREGATPEQLAALEQSLPEEVQQMRKESRQVINLRTSEDELKQQGASAAEIQQWRINEYGVEAAERLAKVDQKQAEWQQRLQAYQNYQQSAALTQLDGRDREKLLAAYQNKHFSANEQKRLHAAMQLLASEH